MIRQARLFLCALQFLTRLPAPRLRGFEPDWIARSAPYYPVVGWIVGALCGALLLATSRLWPGPVPTVLAVGFGVLLTGGFHEDGLADAADGLGGGHTAQRRLEIMKDSRTGSYGVLAIWIVLAIKATALSTLPPLSGAVALVLSHGAARALPTVVMAAYRYADDPGRAKLASFGVRPVEAAVALVLGLAPLPFLLQPSAAILGLGLAALGGTAVAVIARRLIGGFTGDILGAVEQVAEVGLLLGFSARMVGA